MRDQVSHPYRKGNTRVPKTGADNENSGKGKWLLELISEHYYYMRSEHVHIKM